MSVQVKSADVIQADLVHPLVNRLQNAVDILVNFLVIFNIGCVQCNHAHKYMRHLL